MKHIEVLGADKARCTKFKAVMPVTLSKDDAEKAKGDFIMTAYTGQVIPQWWGMLAIDLAGIRATAKMPILREHYRDRIVGHSKESWTDGPFYVSGTFSKVTEDAKEVCGLAEEGFPWQASVGIEPKKVMVLNEGAEMVVNGEVITGPADVWMESEVFETSFVSLGADDNTSVAVFSGFNEDDAPGGPEGSSGAGAAYNLNRSEEMEFTIENLTAKAPDLLKKIQDDSRAESLAQGAENERARIRGVQNACLAGHETLIETLMWDGKSTEADAALAIVQAEKKVRGDKKADLAADAIPPVIVVEPQAPKKAEAKTEQDEILGKEAFEADAELSAEFGKDYESYKAFAEAAGKGLVKFRKSNG